MKRTLTIVCTVLLILVALGAWLTWYKFFREIP
jgi:hypothetical protein